MDPEQGKSSLFAALRKPQESAVPPPPPLPGAAPAANLQPVLDRLAKLEGKLGQEGAAPADQRLAELEQKLKETQEQAIAALVSLREREEAQKTAHAESEALMKSLSAQRRSEEADRQLRDQIATQRRRIEELENRLVESAAGRLDPVLAAQGAAARQIEQLAQQAQQLRKWQEGAESAVAAMMGEVARLREWCEQWRQEDSPEAKLADLRRETRRRAEGIEGEMEEFRRELKEQGRILAELREAPISGAALAEELRSLEAGMAQVRREAVSWRQTHAAQAELLARIEQVKTELAARSDGLTEAVGRLETEARGMILARLLRLEEKLG